MVELASTLIPDEPQLDTLMLSNMLKLLLEGGEEDREDKRWKEKTVRGEKEVEEGEERAHKMRMQ